MSRISPGLANLGQHHSAHVAQDPLDPARRHRPDVLALGGRQLMEPVQVGRLDDDLGAEAAHLGGQGDTWITLGEASRILWAVATTAGAGTRLPAVREGPNRARRRHPSSASSQAPSSGEGSAPVPPQAFLAKPRTASATVSPTVVPGGRQPFQFLVSGDVDADAGALHADKHTDQHTEAMVSWPRGSLPSLTAVRPGCGPSRRRRPGSAGRNRGPRSPGW